MDQDTCPESRDKEEAYEIKFNHNIQILIGYYCKDSQRTLLFCLTTVYQFLGLVDMGRQDEIVLTISSPWSYVLYSGVYSLLTFLPGEVWTGETLDKLVGTAMAFGKVG